MKFNIKLYLKSFYYAFFKAKHTPGRLTPKRLVVLTIIFFFYPLWHTGIRIAYMLDNLFFPEYQEQEIKQPIFIVGNFRSGTTFLHRLLAKDSEATSLTSWEIYLAPSIVGRKLLRWGMRLNYMIGSPVKKVLDVFDRVMAEYSYMHKVGLNEPEEDGHVLFHIWSTYDLVAFFPFPKLINEYIYYDEEVPSEDREQDINYYHNVLKKHVFAHDGKRYVSKNPSYSPKVRTLHQKFPDAKFINIVRNPLQVIPSSISLFSNHFRTYGEPKNKYALQETLLEQARHWYLYPHRYLKHLPQNQYIRIDYRDLVKNPKGTIEAIYRRFGFEISNEYAQVLRKETEKAKKFKSKHKYSLRDMGLSKDRIKRKFSKINKQLGFDA